jgi:hypothetical protein
MLHVFMNWRLWRFVWSASVAGCSASSDFLNGSRRLADDHFKKFQPRRGGIPFNAAPSCSCAAGWKFPKLLARGAVYHLISAARFSISGGYCHGREWPRRAIAGTPKKLRAPF